MLRRLHTLLLRATFDTWDREDTHIAVLSCRVASFEHDAWFDYEQRVGGYHTSQFNAAVLDGEELLRCLQREASFVSEIFWLQMALSQLESTRDSLRLRRAQPATRVFDFWLPVASIDILKQRLQRQHKEHLDVMLSRVCDTLWLAAARCSGPSHADMEQVACLRTLRLVSSLRMYQFPMRLLPESPDCLVVPVEQPTWTREWPDALAQPQLHLQCAESTEAALSNLLENVRSTLGDVVASWIETAWSVTAATVALLRDGAHLEE